MWFILYIRVAIFFWSVYCENTTENTESLLKMYRNYINASHDLEKSDRAMMKTWSSDFVLQIVNITSQYRLDMTRHKDHNFMGIKANPKWKECLNLHRKEIQNSQVVYYEGESKCVKAAKEQETKMKRAVSQMEKEIRKWRKSYKYLSNKCNINNPDDKDSAGACLVEYMQKDNYDVTFQRLILLKLESMSELYKQILTALRGLEECLKTALSGYLSDVRTIMDNLKRCYNIRTLLG